MGVVEDYALKTRGIELIATKTRPNDTTAYTAADVIGTDDWIFDSKRKIDIMYLMSVILRIDVNALPSGMSTFKLHLYKAQTALNLADNAPQTFLTADASNYVGTVAITAPTDKGDFLFSRTDDINMIIPKGKIYGRLETDAGYTPSASTVYTVTLLGVGL